MVIKELITNEMTMRGPNLDKLSVKFYKENTERFSKGKYIADMEDFKVKNTDEFYTLWNKSDELIAGASLTNSTPSEVDQVWVDPNYRGQKIFSKMLWYFKTRLGRSKLILGELHSNIMQDIVKGGLSNFDKSWYKEGETKPFSIDTLDQFYARGRKTGWRLMLENDGDFSDWPKFNGTNFIKEAYEEFIE